MSSYNVLVLGAGKVGKSVAELLLACTRGECRVTVADRDLPTLKKVEDNLARLRAHVPHPVEFSTRPVDAADLDAVRAALAGHDAVISMLPFNFVAQVAAAAAAAGVHYFDVTEDVHAAERTRALDVRASAVVPQCGLAPGFIGIAAHDLAGQFDVLHELTLRVGALPQFPTNALKYNITWSAAGLVNEYCEPCAVLRAGKPHQAPALDGLERFSLEGVEYEAFYTSGGVGSLIDTLVQEGRVGDQTAVAYKTIRYPGHRDLMRFLLHDLRLGERDVQATRAGNVFNRALAVDLLEHALPRTLQDLVVIFITAVGLRRGRREQVAYRRAIRATTLFGRVWPAIELTTAAGVCAMVDLHRRGVLPATGFIPQECCTLEMFSRTPFGLAFDDPAAIEPAVIGAA